MTPAGEPDPRAVAERISAALRVGLEQSPHIVALSPGLTAILTSYLDVAGPMIAAAAEREQLALALAAAESRAADAVARAEAAERRVGELEAALEPFARIGVLIGAGMADNSLRAQIAGGKANPYLLGNIYAGDLRAAARALRREPQP